MKILYATDGSAGALVAGRFLAGLPHRDETQVRVATVLAQGDPDDGGALLDAARAALGSFSGSADTTTLRVATPGAGVVADRLLHAADEHDSDLIVIGASGHSALSRFLLGSISESVARHARQSVLVVRPAEGPLTEVLIGVDGSARSREAACWVAGSLPLPDDCALRIVRVVPPPVWATYPDSYGGLAVPALAETLAEEHSHASKYVAQLARHVGDASGRQVQTEVVDGSPASELIALARTRRSGLVAVGSEGAGGPSHFLLGSVSERVLRHAPCSVLVTRPRTIAG